MISPNRFNDFSPLCHAHIFKRLLRKWRHIFGAHPTVNVQQVNDRLVGSSSTPEQIRGSQTQSPSHIWSAEIASISRFICFVSVVHYLPGDHGGQRPWWMAATVDRRGQRSTEPLKMVDAGGPSSLADAPAPCRAVREDMRGGRERMM